VTVVLGTYMLLPCGKCEFWVEEQLGERAFVVKTKHEDPKACPHYRFIMEESDRRGKPKVTIDERQEATRRRFTA